MEGCADPVSNGSAGRPARLAGDDEVRGFWLSFALAGAPVPSTQSHHEVVRLEPGDDPRARLEALQAERGGSGASVVAAVGA